MTDSPIASAAPPAPAAVPRRQRRPRSKAVLRFFIAHGLSYPIATAWAFASVPALVIAIAAQVGTSLDDAVIAHKVLMGVAWPSGASFALVHVAGLIWGFDPDERRGKRRFTVAMIVLAAVPVILGGGLWIWLMTR